MLSNGLNKMNNSKCCEHCGAKTVKYKHNFNVGLFAGLVKLYEFNQPASLKELELTVNQFNNFQKLRYGGLVENVNAKWVITELGIKFIKNEIAIPRQVTTYRNECVGQSDDFISYNNFQINYDRKDFYFKSAESVEVAKC